MATKLYVGNLPYSATDSQLSDLFSKAGQVVSAVVILDKFSGRSKGFAFIEMSSEDEAQKAIQQFNGYELEGRAIV
ncbi:MAG: RNA-binding protein, partial [bacterium]